MKPIACCSFISKTIRLAMPPISAALVMLLSMASLASSCTEQERSSLLQFVSELSQDGSLRSSWEVTTDCCKWEGINCGPDKTVRDLSLACRNLQGPISASLGNLTGLRRLNLSHNLLSGGMPLELVSSKSIVVLDVSFNQLSGQLQELQSSTLLPLQVLNISSNLFTGWFPSTTWEAMKSLVALNASNNSFTGKISTAFCFNAPSFSVLELSHNQFNGSIPRELGNCSKLTSLNAGHNNLSGTLPNELFNLAFLEHLSLPSNQLEGSLSNMSKLSNLVTIDLGVNVISGSILDSIGELKGLQELHLDYNNISGELPSTLGNCTDLRSINLMSNNFSGGLTKLNFSTLTNLKTLDLAWNNFSGTIPESIYSCSSLNALRLSANKFNGQLSRELSNLKSLSFLSLANNSFKNITNALHILRSLKNLTILLIAHNFENEAMPDDNIRGFEDLRILDIGSCALSGNIPLWISKLANLEILLLGGNRLTGSIPTWINTLNSLFYLDISNNSLTGEIPTALTTMPMLTSKKSTARLQQRVYELPIYVAHALEYHIPTAFPVLLNLGRNNFTGLIPDKIGQLKTLVSLNLGSNKLTGEIPQSICNLTNLQVLDLSGNDLTGGIPMGLNNLHFLSKFNISNNDIEGPIPINGQISTFPSSSFDGNPKLCGPMLAHHCGPAETTVFTEETDERVKKVMFLIAFGAFFGVGVMYDQLVLSRFFG